MSNRRAGTLRGNAFESGCGKRAGKLSELPDTFNGFPLLSRSEREAIYLATGEHLVYGTISDSIPSGIPAASDALNPMEESVSGIIGFRGLLRMHACVVRVRRALPTYGQKKKDGTVVPNQRAYRTKMVPSGFRQPGEPTDNEYWRMASRYMASHGIDYYATNGEHHSPTEVPSGWIMLIGLQEPIQSILDNPPGWCAQSEPCLNARVPVQGSGATGGMTESQKKFKRSSIQEWIEEREAMAIIRSASNLPEPMPHEQLANAIVPIGSHREYFRLRDAVHAVFTGSATVEQQTVYYRHFGEDTNGDILIRCDADGNPILPHGASFEHAQELRNEANKLKRQASIRAKRITGFNDTLVSQGSMNAIADAHVQNERQNNELKASLRFVGESLFPQSIEGMKGATDYNMQEAHELRKKLKQWADEIDLAFRQTYGK